MKNNRLTIRINRPVREVFRFTLNPINTASWIKSIIKEEVSENPTKVGTVYRNQNNDGKWSKYIVTEYKKDKSFVFTSGNGNYHVRYIFSPIYNSSTELEYFEWVDKGELKEPFTIEALNRLKSALEN